MDKSARDIEVKLEEIKSMPIQDMRPSEEEDLAS